MIYVLGKAVCSLVILLLHPFNLKGTENIPQNGKAILVSNHRSNWDPLLIAMLTYREIHFLAKEELFSNPFLGWLFRRAGVIPVNRKKPTVKTYRTCKKVLDSGGLLGIFPEGTRVRDKRVDPLDGFVHFAVRYQAPIIPIHIEGSTKPWHKLSIVIGEPIDLSAQYGSRVSKEKYSQIAKKVMDKIYHLN